MFKDAIDRGSGTCLMLVGFVLQMVVEVGTGAKRLFGQTWFSGSCGRGHGCYNTVHQSSIVRQCLRLQWNTLQQYRRLSSRTSWRSREVVELLQVYIILQPKLNAGTDLHRAEICLVGQGKLLRACSCSLKIPSMWPMTSSLANSESHSGSEPHLLRMERQ